MMKYTSSHEWVRIEGKIATVGISKHAQNQLGEIIFVELPEVGKTILADQEVVVLESTKAAVDIYSPVSGVITQVNEAMKEDLDLLNNSSEDLGWLFKISVKDLSELDTLLDKREYLQVIM